MLQIHESSENEHALVWNAAGFIYMAGYNPLCLQTQVTEGPNNSEVAFCELIYNFPIEFMRLLWRADEKYL